MSNESVAWEWVPETRWRPSDLRISIHARKGRWTRQATLTNAAYRWLLERWPWELPLCIWWAHNPDTGGLSLAPRQDGVVVDPTTRRTYLNVIDHLLPPHGGRFALRPEDGMLIVEGYP